MMRPFLRFAPSSLMLLALMLNGPAQAAFVTNSDGTVTDSATGLIWDQCSWGLSGPTCSTGSASVHNWSQALGVAISANSTNYKSHNNWRLPNSNELESLVDLSRWSPAIDTTAFPATTSNLYWSSTNYASPPVFGWGVVFLDGNSDGYGKTGNGNVRLVRGGQPHSTLDALAPTSGWPYDIVAIAGDSLAAVNFGTADGNGTLFDGYTVVSNPAGGVDTHAGKTNLNHVITGLRNGDSYTFTVMAHSSTGDVSWSVASNPITPAPTGSIPTIGSFQFSPDTLLIESAGGNATAFVHADASSGLAVSFSASTSDICSVSGNTVTAFAPGVCTIAADQGGDASHNAALQVTQSINITSSLPVGATLSFLPSWNLIGHSVNAPLDVASTFGDPASVISVWQWIAPTSTWAFYTPLMTTPELTSFASNKGYSVLTTISGGNGFWVNAKIAFTAQAPAGAPVTTASLQDQLNPTQSKLLPGWNLMAIGDNVTPSAFNRGLSLMPPAPEVIPLNFITLWAWDNGLGNWNFYAPSLEANGGLTNYITSKGYLDFGLKTLEPTSGFWLNK